MNRINVRGRTVLAFLPAAILCLLSVANSQDAVPDEILQRTLLIRGPSEQGTAFSIDYKGKLYLVTARHVVAGVPDTNAVIKIRQAGEWKDYQTVRTLYPPSNEADIAVFETKETASQPFSIQMTGETGGPTMGQLVWFLGYPFIEGIGSQFTNGKAAPFIKRGTMSAIVATNPDAVLLYIDGFNNPGFSGGPIVYWDFTTHHYEIIGVVQGYKNDTAKVMVNGQQVDTQLLVNSGILVGYSIHHAIQAIEQSKQSKP